MLSRRWLAIVGSVTLAIAAVSAVSSPPVASAASCPWVGSTAPVPQRVAQVLAQMSQDQKISLLHGTGGAFVGNTPAIPSLCVPGMGLEDGPAGVGEGLSGVTQLPAPVAVAATWDTAAEQQYGAVVGSEEGGKGAAVNLGPTVNIVRDPRWGRAFESMSEDPYLDGKLGAAEIIGVQNTGVLAQVKHLGVYNQETNRNTPSDNAIIDARTEQEIYLPQFEAAVRQGAASSVMCAYSTVNGAFACQNQPMLNAALRGQFGFTGYVTSDWGGTHSTAASANAGMDQEMPGGDFFGSALATAVQNGQVSQATLNTMVSRVLTEMFTFGLFDNAPHGSPSATVTSSAHVTTARSIAAEGTVLLRNNNNVLPWNTSSTKSIAVIGTDANTAAQTAGGGSAAVRSSGTVTPLQGITNRAGAGVSVQFAPGDTSSGITQAANLARSSTAAVVFVSYNESEGSDRSGIDLTSAQNQLITSVAAANPNTVVVLNTGSAVTMPWVNSVSAVLENWYPGQEDGNAIAALLFGDVNPSGKLPVTFPRSLSDVPASTAAQWPGTNGTVQYSEGMNVGYRWYQARNVTPLFPFGFGLSYTSFGFSNLQVSGPDAHGVSTVTATVTNTGSRAGSEVAQLYVGSPAAAGEPPSQLKGFNRVTLQPGASTTVSFPLTMRDLAHWNNGWTTSTGAYRIMVGDTSASPQLSGTLTVNSTATGNAVSVTSPQGMSSPVGTAASLPMQATDSAGGQNLTWSATGLPAGIGINASTGVISGAATAAGTTTVTVTATDSTGASGSTTFVWTATTGGGGHFGPITAGVAAGLCVDVRSASSANGTAVQIFQCNGTNAQTWTVASGTLQALGKCMDVSGGGTTNGTKVQLWDCNGTGAQVRQPQSNGSLLNPASGRCLDDPGASTANSTQLQIFDCNGTTAQRWTLP